MVILKLLQCCIFLGENMGDHSALEYLVSDESSSRASDDSSSSEDMDGGLRREVRALRMAIRRVKRKIRDLVDACMTITVMVWGVPVDLRLHEVWLGGLARAAAQVQEDPHMRARFLASVDEELERLEANRLEIQVLQEELNALTHSLNEIC